VRVSQSAPYLDHLAEIAREYGGQAMAEAATTVLASVITMLNGLIGEDLAMSILEVVPAIEPNASTADAADAADASPPTERKTGSGGQNP
jgi:hypothetical protein